MNYAQKKEPLYELSGKVVHGRGKGHAAGMPTANLEVLPGTDLPVSGVYAAKVYLEGKEFKGVTNVGLRPTADCDKDVTIETFIIDFDGDIYGDTIYLQLFALLRGQQKFEDMSKLREQLYKDCSKAQKILGL